MAGMSRGGVVAVLLQLVLLYVQPSSSCPSVCRCSVDHHGRSTVTCQQGDLRDVIPIFDMADNTKVLIVTAPPQKENYLSLGPIFQGLRRLEEIHITWSNIPNLGEHSFWGLHHLEILNLTWNRLTSLRDTNFKGAKSLKRLDLSHNRIESVPSAAFRHIRQLRYLGLSYNSIPELVPRIFFGLTHLEYLDLSHNPIQRLDADIFTDISLLKTFKCSACALTTFSRTLLSMISDVRVLDLSNNKLTRVPDLIHAVPYLVSLQLDGNLIALVDKLTLVNSRLTHLHLAHNRIVRVEPDSFINSSLSHLDLMYNRLTHLNPEGIKSMLGNLKVLKISGNPINVVELQKILFESQRLHELGLGDVGLASLPPDLLTHNSNLRHLNLSANYLTSLPMELFISCPNLQVLDLSSNSYKGLSTEILEGLSDASHLRVLRLEGNPWICDQCHVSPLLHWLHGAPDQESGCAEPKVWTCLKCLGPPRFAGLELALLPPADLPACSYTPTLAAPSFMQEPTQVNNLSMAVQAEFPRGELTRQNTANIDRSDHDLVELDPPWTLADLIKDRFYTIVIASCVFLVCLLFLILIAIFAYHRQTAFYYTNEHEMSCRGSSVDQQPKIVKNNNNKSPKKLQKKASIATIEEVRDIAGTTELKHSVVLSSLNRNSSCNVDIANVGVAETDVAVSQSTKDTYQTVVDELGRTKLCKKSNKVPLIQVLDSEPRPGKG